MGWRLCCQPIRAFSADSDPPHSLATTSSHGMLARLQRRRLVLRADRELGGEEAMLLRHRRLGAIEHIVDELTSIRRLDALAVDVVRPLLVDEEEMVAAGSSGDVHVLPQLDV